MCCHSHEARRPVVQGNIESNQVAKIPVLVLLSLFYEGIMEMLSGELEYPWTGPP
jgi:hypothetical protein